MLFNAKNLQFFFPSLSVLDIFQELLSRNNCNFYALNSNIMPYNLCLFDLDGTLTDPKNRTDQAISIRAGGVWDT